MLFGSSKECLNLHLCCVQKCKENFGTEYIYEESSWEDLEKFVGKL